MPKSKKAAAITAGKRTQVGMTRVERLLSGSLATWMDGFKSGFPAAIAGPSTTLRVGRDDNSREECTALVPSRHQSPGAPHPRFPVEFRGFPELHAPFLKERRTRGPVQCCVQEIRGISLVFREMWDTAGLPLKPAVSPTDPHGCPTFAPAYVGRKRWAKPTTAFCSNRQEN